MEPLLCTSENCSVISHKCGEFCTNNKHYEKQIATMICDECGPLCSTCSIFKHPWPNSHRTIFIIQKDDLHRIYESTQKDMSILLEKVNIVNDEMEKNESKEKENDRLIDVVLPKFDETDCKADDIEKKCLNLSRQTDKCLPDYLPEYCFHKTCFQKGSKCSNLHLEMRELLYIKKKLYKSKRDMKHRLEQEISNIMRSVCTYGFIDIFEKMIENGFGCEYRDPIYHRTLLHEAIDYSQKEIVIKLLPFMSTQHITHEQYHSNPRIRRALDLAREVFLKNKTKDAEDIFKAVNDRCLELCI